MDRHSIAEFTNIDVAQTCPCRRQGIQFRDRKTMDEIHSVDEMAIDAGIEMLHRYAATLLAQPPSDEEAWQSSEDLTDDETVFPLMLERLWNAASSQEERRQVKRDLLLLASAIRARHSRGHHDELWAALTLESFVKERLGM